MGALCLCCAAIAQPPRVRLAVVNTPDDLLRELAPEFEKQEGYRIEFAYIGEEPHEAARKGEADVVISHFGHPGTEPFLADGMGLWPVMIFANQAVLIGPPGDPANLRGVSDAVEAFRRIAESGARFLVNNAATERYLAQVLAEAAGRSIQADWYVDSGLRDQPAVQAASRMGAYTLWGLPPFLRYKAATADQALEVFVSDDSIFQRVMVSMVVNPEKVEGINVEGARALQRFVLLPATQARIRAFRYPGFDRQAWWPFGRHNSAARLQ